MADKLYISKVHLPDGKDYELKDLDARESIERLEHIGLKFVVSTDAATTPAGVTWLNGSTEVVGTLTADATIDAIYLVPDTDIPGAGEGVSKYIEYVCVLISKSPDTYIWEAIGSTDAKLDNLGNMAKANTASATAVTFNGTLGVVQSTGTFTAHGTVSKPAVDVTTPVATFNAGALPTKAADTFTQGTLPSKAADTFDAGTLPSFTYGAFDAGSLPSKEADVWNAGTLPTKAADTFSAGTLPSKAADTWNAGALPSKAADTFVKPVLTAEVASGTETLTISFSQGSFTEGAFNAGSLPSFTEGSFSAGTLPSFTEGAFTQGTLPSFTEGAFDPGALPSKTADTFNAGALPSFTEGAFSAGTLPTYSEGAFNGGALPGFKDANDVVVSQVVMGVSAELHEAPTFTGTAGEALVVNTAGTDAISTTGNITVNPDPRA